MGNEELGGDSSHLPEAGGRAALRGRLPGLRVDAEVELVGELLGRYEPLFMVMYQARYVLESEALGLVDQDD